MPEVKTTLQALGQQMGRIFTLGLPSPVKQAKWSVALWETRGQLCRGTQVETFLPGPRDHE